MRATALLSELQTAGVVVMATPDGNLELDAPRGVLSEEKLIALRQHKAEIIGLLSSCCPFCGYHGMRHEQTMKGNLLYLDTICAGCGELIECYVPAQQTSNAE